MTRINKLLILFGLSAASLSAAATQPTAIDCERDSLGWNFYCEEPELLGEEFPDTETSATSDLSPEEVELAAVQKELKRLRSIAVVNPTRTNVERYMRFKREQLDRASLFADQTRRVIWTNPDLDYTLQRPTGNLAKNAWIDERKLATTSALKQVPDKYGVFFFFRSDCPFCHKFAPILRDFVDRNELDILAVSLDGGGLPYWPEAVPNHGQAQKLGFDRLPVPSLALVNKESGEVTPIGFGLMSQEELSQRIYVLTTMEAGDDF
ncbi:MAG: conjugal transfer protein TraF [Gammaproteobacteria bacterium]|nr:conjugal transfer protein TraF [Gammaproteobacteria bacterium]